MGFRRYFIAFIFVIFAVLTVTVASANQCRDLFFALNAKSVFSELKLKIEVLPTPLAISSYAEIYALKHRYDSSGVKVGQTYSIRVFEPNVKEFNQHRGSLADYRTEMNELNQNLFESLGFKETSDPRYGKFWSEIPDAPLFNYLKNKYNEQVPESLQIHVSVYESPVVSAQQSEIVSHWISQASVALANPRLGSVLGTEATEFAKQVVNGKEKLSTFRHDTEHFGSLVLVPKKVVTVNQQVGRFWEKVLRTLYQHGQMKETVEFREIMDAVYLYNRRFHSLTHVLGMLARAGGVIDIKAQHVLNFGQSAEIETPAVHWPGLGFQPGWITKSHLPFENRLFELNLQRARQDRQLVSMADAYHMVTNKAITEAQEFITEFNRNHPHSPLTLHLQTWFQELRLAQFELTEQELIQLQNLTLQRHRRMGNETEP